MDRKKKYPPKADQPMAEKQKPFYKAYECIFLVF
jgi:hypothetical protein